MGVFIRFDEVDEINESISSQRTRGLRGSERTHESDQNNHSVRGDGRYGEKGSQSYWKIKNSWASDWGEDGYYRIEYGKNLCGLAFDAVHSHD